MPNYWNDNLSTYMYLYFFLDSKKSKKGSKRGYEEEPAEDDPDTGTGIQISS